MLVPHLTQQSVQQLGVEGITAFRTFLTTYGLGFDPAYPLALPGYQGGMWVPVLRYEALLEIVRGTGLWLPGKIRFDRMGTITSDEPVPGRIVAYASCYARQDASSPWIEVEAHATRETWEPRVFAEMSDDLVERTRERLLENPDQRNEILDEVLTDLVATPTAPRDPWTYMPHEKLGEVAMIQAIRKIFGRSLGSFLTSYDVPRPIAMRSQYLELLDARGAIPET